MPISPISTRLFCARTESGCVGDFPGFSDLNQETCNSKYNTNVPVWLSANLVENTSQLDGSSMFIMTFSPEIAGTTHFQDITLWWLKTLRHWKWPLSSMIYEKWWIFPSFFGITRGYSSRDGPSCVDMLLRHLFQELLEVCRHSNGPVDIPSAGHVKG